MYIYFQVKVYIPILTCSMHNVYKMRIIYLAIYALFALNLSFDNQKLEREVKSENLFIPNLEIGNHSDNLQICDCDKNGKVLTESDKPFLFYINFSAPRFSN